MKLDDATRNEKDLLDALQVAIDEKRRPPQLKRNHTMVEPPVSGTTTTTNFHGTSDTTAGSEPAKKRPRGIPAHASLQTSIVSGALASERDANLPVPAVSNEAGVYPPTEPSVLLLQIDRNESLTQARLQTSQTVEAEELSDQWQSFLSDFFAF